MAGRKSKTLPFISQLITNVTLISRGVPTAEILSLIYIINSVNENMAELLMTLGVDSKRADVV